MGQTHNGHCPGPSIPHAAKEVIPQASRCGGSSDRVSTKQSDTGFRFNEANGAFSRPTCRPTEPTRLKPTVDVVDASSDSKLRSLMTKAAAERRKPKSSMRRHHFLSLRDTDHPPDSISLLIGAQADQRRRRSTQIPPSLAKEMHRRLSSLLGGVVPGEADDNSPGSLDRNIDNEGDDEDEDAPGFLRRVNSYSRLMHAHTKSQLARPTVGTLPSYKKTMHAFTLNQLNSHRRASQTQSETSSSRMSGSGERFAVPAKLQAEVSKLVLNEVPPARGSTPETDGGGGGFGMGLTSAGVLGGVEIGKGESYVHGIDFRKLKRRSITDPDLVRSIASSGIGVRDFAAG